MISSEILEYIECAIPHNCPKKINSNLSTKCAHCDIDYKFIAKQPVILQCDHQICLDCENKAQRSSLKCKICESMSKNSPIRSSGAKNKLLEKTLNEHLGEFYAELKSKFQKGREFEIEKNVASKRQIIKNEIDLEVESVKEQLEMIRRKLHAEVDEHCDMALQ